MSIRPDLFVRVSMPHGHDNMPAAVARRSSRVRVLEQAPVDDKGRLLPPKPRVEVEDAPKPRRKRATKPRVNTVAATPTPTEPETVSGDTPEE